MMSPCYASLHCLATHAPRVSLSCVKTSTWDRRSAIYGIGGAGTKYGEPARHLLVPLRHATLILGDAINRTLISLAIVLGKSTTWRLVTINIHVYTDVCTINLHRTSFYSYGNDALVLT